MIHTVAETGSTNADLLMAAAAGAPEGTWLRAERQSGGRGRIGRPWRSPPGNLYASTIVRLGGSEPPAPTLALVAGVALHDAAKQHAPGVPLALKWPNDLLSGPGKLAGILLERTGDAVVIGFGLNLANHPDGLDRPVTSLAALTGAHPAADAVLGTLIDRLSHRVAEWRRDGLAAIRAHWLARAHPRGTPLRVTLDGAAFEGAFEGLSADGALLLAGPDGAIRTVHAGDVFLV